VPNRRQQTMIPKLAGILLLLFIAGCEHNIIHPLSSEESAAIKSGDSAIVLLRLTIEDQNRDQWNPLDDLRDGFVYRRIAVGDFDSGGKLQSHDIQISSAEARNEGWLTLRLSPGYYYIGRAIFAGAGYNDPEPAPRWRIEVPPGTPVIYAGTFHFWGRSGYVLFEGRRIVETNYAATKIDDETELAVQTARRDLPSLPPPVTRLAVLHSGPILLGVPPPARPSE
jgi:hypothetical protein